MTGDPVSTGRLNGQSKLISVRFRRSLMWRLESRALGLGLPYHEALQALLGFALDELDAGRGPSKGELEGRMVREGPRTGSGAVYFLQAGGLGGLVKIGWISNSKRLGVLSPRLELLLAVPGERGTLERTHEKFASSRVRGDWYRPDGDLLSGIAQIKAAFDIIKGIRR